MPRAAVILAPSALTLAWTGGALGQGTAPTPTIPTGPIAQDAWYQGASWLWLLVVVLAVLIVGILWYRARAPRDTPRF